MQNILCTFGRKEVSRSWICNEFGGDLGGVRGVLEEIISSKYDFEFGARPLKRLLEEKILNPLSNKILESNNKAGKFNISLNKKKEVELKFILEKKEKEAIQKQHNHRVSKHVDNLKNSL